MHEWLSFLRQAGAGGGIPFVLAGAALMLFGWRIWKICVVLSFGLVGAALGAAIAVPGEDRLVTIILCALSLGLLSYWPAKLAASALGGVVGGGIIFYSLSNIGVHGTALLSAMAAAVFCASFYAYLHREYFVVLLTAAMGAALLMSGLATWLMAWPELYSIVHSLALGNAIVLPFILLVPASVSCFYQMGEMRRQHAEV